MKDKTRIYQEEQEVDFSEIDLSSASLEVNKTDEKSLEIISQFISFLYQADRELSEDLK